MISIVTIRRLQLSVIVPRILSTLARKDHFFNTKGLHRTQQKLLGGWTNPFEKYARQTGNLPQMGVNIKKYKYTINGIWHDLTFKQMKHSPPPPVGVLEGTRQVSPKTLGRLVGDLDTCHRLEATCGSLHWNGWCCHAVDTSLAFKLFNLCCFFKSKVVNLECFAGFGFWNIKYETKTCSAPVCFSDKGGSKVWKHMLQIFQ